MEPSSKYTCLICNSPNVTVRPNPVDIPPYGPGWIELTCHDCDLVWTDTADDVPQESPPAQQA